MRIPFTQGPGTVGREDRLVRGCIALSLLLLAGFAVVISGELSVISIGFLLLGLHFAVTAVLGRDPFYAHFGIDTRGGAEPAAGSEADPAVADGSRHWLDLRDSQSDLTTGSSGSSLLGT
jgi:hypothetical protein